MSEVPIINCNAVVLKFDRSVNQWKPQNQNLCRVAIYFHQTNNTFRVVSMDPQNQVLINSYIFKELVGSKLQDKFYQWTDQRQETFGLNFTDSREADNFSDKMKFCIEALKGDKLTQTQTQPQPQTQTQTQPQTQTQTQTTQTQTQTQTPKKRRTQTW